MSDREDQEAEARFEEWQETTKGGTVQTELIKSTHKQKVLGLLKQSGRYGAFGHELAKQEYGGFRFSEYIRQLRQEGHNIITKRISGSDFKYYLVQESLREDE